MLKSVQRAENKRLLKYLSFQVRHGLSLEQALKNVGFRKEGAERKEILDDMEKNGLVPQEYMDETIRQNLELKKQLEKAEALIEKMKCCENCQTVRDADGFCYLWKDRKCTNLEQWTLRGSGDAFSAICKKLSPVSK